MNTTVVDVVLATEHQANQLGRAMGRAFQDEPNFTYIIPDHARRQEALAWFFGSFVARLGRRYGRVDTTTDTAGGAVWAAPGSHVTFRGAIEAGLLAMPARFGWGGVRRSLQLSRQIERVRQQYAPTRHWYLMALGVDPAVQGRGIGSALVRPVLSQADATGTACYLETVNERNLAFYGRLGFEVVAEDRHLHGGPTLWGMVRTPQT